MRVPPGPDGAGLLDVPVGGGPPASRPRRELRSARRLEARPGPATAHGHRSQALRSLRHPPHLWGLCDCCCVARRLEARPGPATAHRHPGQAPRFAARPFPPDPPPPFTPVGPGVPACRTPNDANSPFGGREFVAWRARVRVSGLTCAISPMRAEAVPW